MENDNTLDQDMLDASSSNPDSNLAGRGKRFANMLVDVVCFYVFVFVAALLFELLAGHSSGANSGGFLFLIYGSYFLYYMLMEGILGKTIGKMVTKTKVVDENGAQLTMGKAATRTLCRIIPFDAFSFFAKFPVGWHDSITKTRVVNNR